MELSHCSVSIHWDSEHSKENSCKGSQWVCDITDAFFMIMFLCIAESIDIEYYSMDKECNIYGLIDAA